MLLPRETPVAELSFEFGCEIWQSSIDRLPSIVLSLDALYCQVAQVTSRRCRFLYLIASSRSTDSAACSFFS